MTPEEIKQEAEKYARKKYTDRIAEYAAGSSLNAIYENCLQDYSAGYTSAQSNMDAEMIAFTQWAQRERWAFIDADKNKKWGKYLSVNSKKGYCYEWKSSTQLLALFRKEGKG